ncbi:MAG: alpha/beta fold hydrolase [Candidatus Nanopelagicales bacterium]
MEGVERRTVRTPDGRRLTVHLAGPDEGIPVLVHHGTPGSSRPYPELLAAARARGLRWVGLSRPGYDGSDRLAGRDVATVAADVATVLDALGAPDALVAGWSGGGPHALATAALLPQRTRAVAVLAGVAPWDAEGLDPTAGMGEDNVVEFDAAVAGEHALRPLLADAAEGLREVGGPDLAAAMASLLPEVDVRALEAGAGDWLAASFHAGLVDGVDGWVDDDLAFVRPWGVDLDDLAGVPVAIWQGDRDLMVPPAHGRWLVDHVPHAEAHLLPADGHLSLTVDRADEVVAALVAAGR